jgi:hypothetical protein
MAAVAPVKSLAAVSVTGPGTPADNLTPFGYHRMTVTMSGYTGSGAVIVQLEVAFDSTDTWIPLPSGAQAFLVANGTVVAPQAGNQPYPARLIRANLLAWPASVTGGTVTAWVGSY